MKNALKRSLSFLLAIVFIFSAAYIDFSEIDFGAFFTIEALASNEDFLIYTLNADGESYSVHCNNPTIVGEIVIPSSYKGLSVTKISDNAFRNCYDITSIVIPNSITEIGNEAFMFCKSLRNVTIPNNVSVLGYGIFSSCYSLFYVNIGNGVTVITENMFSYCRNLKAILLPLGLKRIENNVFLKCDALKDVCFKGTAEVFENVYISDVGNSLLNSVNISYNYAYDEFYAHVFTTDDSIKIYQTTKSPISFNLSDSTVAEIEKTSYVRSDFGEMHKKTAKLDIINDIGATFKYGEYYDYRGKYRTGESGIMGSDFIPIENFDENIEAYSSSYCVWDKDKNYLRGYWEVTDELVLNPDMGDAYITVTAIANEKTLDSNGRVQNSSVSYFVLSRNIEISDTEKTFEIFGDSISTFEGYIVDGNSPFYKYGVTVSPANKPTDVTDVSNTWWKKLETDTCLKMVRNDSHSGRCLSYTYYGGHVAPGYSFVEAVRKRFENTTLENPDVFMIYGGTNDVFASLSSGGVGYENNIGEAKYSDWTEEDFEFVAPSVCYIIDLIQKNAPGSEIVFILDESVSLHHSKYGKAIESICAEYGVAVCKVCHEDDYGDVHPNDVGMTQIKNKLLYTLSNNDFNYDLCSEKSTYEQEVVINLSPLKPGKCNLEIYDSTGIMVDSLPLLVIEGSHQYEFSKVKTEPTCTSLGVEIQKCKFCGDEYEKTLDLISHKSTDWIIDEKPTCLLTGTKHKECIECEKVLEKADVLATGHIKEKDSAVSPTCTTGGLTEGTHCSVCNEIIQAQTIIPATGHTMTDWINDSVATCTTAGSKHKECTKCGEILETETIPETGHTEVKDPAVATTCTKTGKTEGSHCSVCNLIIKAQTTIPANGHTVVIDSAVSPTCSANGLTEGSHCSECNTVLVQQETIPSTAHTPSTWIVVDSVDVRYKVCTKCGKILESQKIPLAAPTINSCYNEVDGVQLGWTAVGEATSYRVYRKLPTDKNWTLLTTTTALTYRDKKVTGNTAYQYSVKALDKNNNESDFSALKENRYIEFPKLTSRASAVGGVQITWQKVAGATSYRIYRRGAASNNWSYLGEVSATQSTFLDKEGTASNQIKSGNYYRYTVRASYSGKDSFGKDHLRYSGFDTNGLYLKYMATPKLTSISNAGAGNTEGIKVTWNKVNGGGTTWYRVYRRGANSSNWRYLGATQGNTWTDTETKNYSGNYYRYTVRAVAGTQDTGWYSAFDTNGLYIKRIANPTLKSATSAKAGITVKWSPVKGTTGYYVYRKTANSGWQCVGTVKGTNNVTFLDKTAVKGTTYTYTVRACYGTTKSYFNSGIKCYDKY